MDYNKLSHDELIEKCKELKLEYLTKANKPKAIKTLITLLNKNVKNNDEQPKKSYEENYSSLETIIDKCHNYLYTKGITGSKAQNDIMKFFTIKIINYLYNNNNEYIISLIENYKNTIDCLIDFKINYNENIDNIDDENVKDTIQEYLNYIEYLKNISLIITLKDKTRDINDEWKTFVEECLSKIFPDIYSTKDCILNCDYKYAIQEIITIISKFNISSTVIDEVQSFNGDIHEKFLKYQGNRNSKELGQFFTPREIVKSIINDCGFKELIEDLNGNELTLYDPCLGTGGLLCYTYNACKSKIKKENIYGCEIENDTMKLGIVSLMISTNSCNKNIKRCNSLIENPYLFEGTKFNIIYTNPPFSTKTNYKQLENDFNNYKNHNYPSSSLKFKDIYTLPSNTGIQLFIQNIIYLLKDNGIACIILPDGEIMIGKSSLNIRKLIIDNCQLLKVITINGGAFTNTSIKTKALIIKKIINDNYNKEIEYLDISANEVKHMGFEKLNDNLHFNLTTIEKEIKYSEDIEIKTLGEVCKFKNGKNITKAELINGDYPVIGGGKKPIGFHNNYNCEENTILCSSSGSAGYISKYNKKIWASDCFTIIPIYNNLNNIYLYYYLKYIQNNIYKLQSGSGQPHVYSKDLEKLTISIPSLEKQEIIVNFLDKLNEINEDNQNKIDKLKKINELHLNIILSFKKVEIKTLGEVCKVNQGTYIKSDMKIQGQYPVYGGGNISFYINQYNREDDIIIAKDGISSDCIRYEKNKFFLNHHGWTLILKEEIIKKYMYYYLYSIQLELLNIAKGVAQLGINQENFYNLKIPIPSLEVQNEIVEYLDYNNEVINNLEKEIEYNKKKAEEYFKQIL